MPRSKDPLETAYPSKPIESGTPQPESAPALDEAYDDAIHDFFNPRIAYAASHIAMPEDQRYADRLRLMRNSLRRHADPDASLQPEHVSEALTEAFEAMHIDSSPHADTEEARAIAQSAEQVFRQGCARLYGNERVAPNSAETVLDRSLRRVTRHAKSPALDSARSEFENYLRFLKEEHGSLGKMSDTQPAAFLTQLDRVLGTMGDRLRSASWSFDELRGEHTSKDTDTFRDGLATWNEEMFRLLELRDAVAAHAGAQLLRDREQSERHHAEETLHPSVQQQSEAREAKQFSVFIDNILAGEARHVAKTEGKAVAATEFTPFLDTFARLHPELQRDASLQHILVDMKTKIADERRRDARCSEYEALVRTGNALMARIETEHPDIAQGLRAAQDREKQRQLAMARRIPGTGGTTMTFIPHPGGALHHLYERALHDGVI